MEIEITVNDDGTLEIQGYNLPAGIPISQIAKFLTDKLGSVTELGHKHHAHSSEVITEKLNQSI